MSALLKNKIVLIIGGSKGIGRAAALEFAHEGARIVIASRTPKEGEEVVTSILAAGGDAVYRQADIADMEAMQFLVNETVATFGQLDIAFNNAGFEGPNLPMVEQNISDFERLIDINLKGVFFAMKFEIKQMILQGQGGAIINTSSIAGIVGMPQGAIYAASKHGVIGLSKSAALEYAEANIRINTISPAATDTPMLDRFIKTHPNFGPIKEAKQRFGDRYPLKRIATDAEVAQAAVWLASDKASFVTGANLVIDGGITVG